MNNHEAIKKLKHQVKCWENGEDLSMKLNRYI